MSKHKCLISLCISLFILSCENTFDDGSAVTQETSLYQQFVTTEHLFGIGTYENNNAWLVGYEGTIVYTGNAGKSWETQDCSCEANLYDACFVDSKTGWIVGKLGTILHTTDGGNKWIKQNSGTERRLFEVQFMDSNTGWVVGTMGTILHTRDGGENWVDQGFGEDRYYNGVFFIDERWGWIVGEYNTIYHTEDAGKIWVSQKAKVLIPEEPKEDFAPPPPHLYGVYFISRDIGWATGMDGIIIKTEDGGKTWKRLDTEAEFTIYKIYIEANKGLAIGDRGEYLVSNDGGNTWKKLEDIIRTRFWLRDMVFTDASHAWIVGAFGTILHTKDGAITWEKLSGSFIQ